MAPLPSVKTQRAVIRVDTEAQSFSGWTELRVAAPGGGSAASAAGTQLGLHCYGLSVSKVLVNGVPATFDLQPPVSEELPEGVVTAPYESQHAQLAAVAESAFFLYERHLQRERQPELSVTLPSPLPPLPGEPPAEQHASPQKGRAVARDLLLRVEFGGGGGGGGLRFWRRYAATHSQVRRTSAWLPCADLPSASVSFELGVTCRADETAVGPGKLERQSWEDEGRQWRTFHYTVPVTCAPCHLGFAVGTFRVVAEEAAPRKTPKHVSFAADGAAPPPPPRAEEATPKPLTHFAPREPPAELEVAALLAVPPPSTPTDAAGAEAAAAAADGLARSAHFFTLAFALFEELLGARCPLPAAQQVFLPPELLLGGGGQSLAGLQMLGTGQIVLPRAIEQSLAARCAIARCLARQWFGVLLRAATPLDEWLVEGLSGWLEEQVVRKYVGRNELAYRRWRERQAIFLADNGEAPPLAARGLAAHSPWGPLYGTERLDPSRLWSTKATAVVAMLERRAGEELFRKHVGTVVARALTALQAEQAAASGAAAAPPAATVASPSPRLSPAQAAAPGASPQQQAAGREGKEEKGTRLLDTMTFLNDLGRAGSFKKEMGPFAARWVYGRGVPRIDGAYLLQLPASVLELALKQTGPESARRAADVAERAAVAEGSNAGIIKVVVREGESVVTDHLVHLGAEAFVVAGLSFTPVVEKKAPGRRKRKPEGAGAAEEPDVPPAIAATPDAPVLWVRLDPACEHLADIRLLQPERALAAQLMQSRDVVAQAEAIQRLAELRVHSTVRRPPGLQALKHTLRDRSVFFRVRCDAALALAQLRDEQGQPAGLPHLLDFYKSSFFYLGGEEGADVPRSVAVSDPSEYFVAQAVVTAVSLCREPDSTTPMDSLLFLSTCLDRYVSVPGAPFSDYGLVAALCASLGNIRFEGFGDTLLVLLEEFLKRDAVLVSPGSAVGCACLAAMASLCANGTCSDAERERAALTARRVRQSPAMPVAVRHAALAATLSLTATQRGPAAALAMAVSAAEARHGGGAAPAGLQLPAASTPAFVLEEAAQLVAAANEAAAAAAEVGHMFQGAGAAAPPPAAVPAPMPLLARVAALLSAGEDCRLRHLAFVVLQLLAVQPPTLFRPPPGEGEEDASLLAVAGVHAAQAASMGVTHAEPSAGAAAAPKIKLHIGGAAFGAAPSGGPALSGDRPAVSDARALSFGQVEQPLAPLEAQGQVFSPVRPPGEGLPFGSAPPEALGQEVSSLAQQQVQQGPLAAAEPSLWPPPGQAPPPAEQAGAPAQKLRFKVPLAQQQSVNQAAPEVGLAAGRPRRAAALPAASEQEDWASPLDAIWPAPPLVQQASVQQASWQQQGSQQAAPPPAFAPGDPFAALPPAASATPAQYAAQGWQGGAQAAAGLGGGGPPPGAAPGVPPPVAGGGPPKTKIKLKVKLGGGK